MKKLLIKQTTLCLIGLFLSALIGCGEGEITPEDLLDLPGTDGKGDERGTPQDSLLIEVQGVPGVDYLLSPRKIFFYRQDWLPWCKKRQVGEILYSGQREGFFRKISEPLLINNVMCIITTADATLADTGLTDFSSKLTSTLAYTGRLPSQGPGRFLIQTSGNGQVAVDSFHFDFQPKTDLSVEVKNGAVNYFKAIAEGLFEADLQATITGLGKTRLEGSLDLLTLSSPPLVVQVGPVPIIYRTRLVMGVGTKSTITGTISMKVGGHIKSPIKAGAIFDQGAWQPVGEHTLVITPSVSLERSEGTYDVNLYAYAKLYITFYEALGPVMSIKPYIAQKGTFSSYKKPVVEERKYGLKGELNGDVTFLPYLFLDRELKLFDYSQPF